jgi:hypothetical protein
MMDVFLYTSMKSFIQFLESKNFMESSNFILDGLIKKVKDLMGKNKKWEIQETLKLKPQHIPSDKEVFPTLLTPWKRFLKESIRVYENTKDGNILLHFPPSRAP